MAVSGRHGTSTVDILDVFAAEIKFASLDATPPRAMKPTDPARLHTAEFTFVTRRLHARASQSCVVQKRLASMSNPVQLKHLSSANVFEYVIPPYAPSSTNTPRAPKPPAISTNVTGASTTPPQHVHAHVHVASLNVARRNVRHGRRQQLVSLGCSTGNRRLKHARMVAFRATARSRAPASSEPSEVQFELVIRRPQCSPRGSLSLGHQCASMQTEARLRSATL